MQNSNEPRGVEKEVRVGLPRVSESSSQASGVGQLKLPVKLLAQHLPKDKLPGKQGFSPYKGKKDTLGGSDYIS